MTISQYYDKASRGSSSSSTSITQQQLADIIGNLKEEWRNEINRNLKEEVRNEIEEENKRSLEKLKQKLKDAIKIDDVVRVSVEKVLYGDAQVPFSTSKIQHVRHALQTFIAWPTNLVKIVSHEVNSIL